MIGNIGFLSCGNIRFLSHLCKPLLIHTICIFPFLFYRVSGFPLTLKYAYGVFFICGLRPEMVRKAHANGGYAAMIGALPQTPKPSAGAGGHDRESCPALVGCALAHLIINRPLRSECSLVRCSLRSAPHATSASAIDNQLIQVG